MGKKSQKKVSHSKKEEKQAIKVLVTIGVVALILVFLMFVFYSYA